MAALFAISLVPMLVAAGFAVDYSRVFSLRSAMQDAVDASVMAAAIQLRFEPASTDAQLQSLARTTFESNTTALDFANSAAVTVSLSIDAEMVKVQATARVPMTLMKLIGYEDLDVVSLGEAPAPPFEAEVALLLDHSNSMTGPKHTAMIDGASRLFDVLTSSGTNSRVQIGLVPFAGAVYASLPGKYVLGAPSASTWTNCTRDRRWPYNLSENAPIPGNGATQWGRTDGDDVIGPAEYDICAAFPSANLQLRRITADHSSTRSQLLSMQTVGGTGTNIAAALQFGWQLLSPEGLWADGGAYGTKDKIVMILSDGGQTTVSFGADGSFEPGNASANIRALCANMKSKGITIATIAYQIDDAAAKEDLRACASSSELYSETDATTIAELLRSTGRRLIARSMRLTK